MSVRYPSNTFRSDRHLIDIDLRVFAIWVVLKWTLCSCYSSLSNHVFWLLSECLMIYSSWSHNRLFNFSVIYITLQAMFFSWAQALHDILSVRTTQLKIGSQYIWCLLLSKWWLRSDSVYVFVEVLTHWSYVFLAQLIIWCIRLWNANTSMLSYWTNLSNLFTNYSPGMLNNPWTRGKFSNEYATGKSVM